MFSYTSNNMWELFALFSTTFYISCFQLKDTLAVLQSSVPVLKLDLRLGPVVVRGYSRNNGKAPVIEGQNSSVGRTQKAGNRFNGQHRVSRITKSLGGNDALCWSNSL